MPQNYRLLFNRFWIKTKTSKTANANQIHIIFSVN